MPESVLVQYRIGFEAMNQREEGFTPWRPQHRKPGCPCFLKVGYARVFTRHGRLPDGTIAPTACIINSGFYLTSDSVFVQRIPEALEDGQPSMMFGISTLEDGGVAAGMP